ncbi:uncharacterized protein LOC141527905 [Cotesia typhae]|uniref:uncharacterized protein LOC141527905 n=1 Tax=Cotesia typhae TaxID=2053667 RepID=UPI003D691755
MKMSNTLYVLLIPFLGASVIGGSNNPFFGEWSSEISEAGDAVSLAFPAIADLPEDMMIRVLGEVNGDRIFSNH